MSVKNCVSSLMYFSEHIVRVRCRNPLKALLVILGLVILCSTPVTYIDSEGHLSCVSIIAQSQIIDIIHVLRWLLKVLRTQTAAFLSKLLF